MLKVVNLQKDMAKKMEGTANYDGAVENYKICLEKLEKVKLQDSDDAVLIHADIANVNMIQKKYKDALTRYNSCLSIIQSIRMNDTQIHANILKKVSSVHRSLNNVPKSINCL